MLHFLPFRLDFAVHFLCQAVILLAGLDCSCPPRERSFCPGLDSQACLISYADDYQSGHSSLNSSCLAFYAPIRGLICDQMLRSRCFSLWLH